MELIMSVIYDTIKLIFFLFTISAGVGFFRTYISEQKIKETLLIKHGFKGHLFASLLGSVTHFSSKSSIKLFYNFLESGVPLGVSLSFLIASPIVNEYVAILMLVFFGWKITLAYVFIGIFIGTFAGLILSKFNLEKYLYKKMKGKLVELEKKTTIKNRIKIGLNEALTILKKLWIFLVLGIFLNAGIRYYFTGEGILKIVNSVGIFGVPIAILIGVPFPGSGAAIIPIAVALFEKGIPLGTALGFLMAVVALSLRRAKELRKIMEMKLIILFFTIIILSIILISYAINFIQLF